MCANSHNLYIDKKNYKHGEYVKLLGHVAIFNNIPAIFLSVTIAVLRACGQLLR